MIFDSHTHIDTGVGLGIGIEGENKKELSEFEMLIANKQLGVLVNAASIDEYEVLSRSQGIFVSFGIHPWSAEDFNVDNVRRFESYYKNANAIGEIGMDSVWCNCDLELQKKLFIEQLDMAEAFNKPIVIHTKGQEKEIVQIIESYSIRKLVHWYSCEEHLEKFIEQDCYFTVGPNYKISSAVKKVIELVPLNRLLVETDGISAVEWAVDRKIKPCDIPSILEEAMEAIAEEKNLERKTVEKKLEENFYRFIGI